MGLPGMVIIAIMVGFFVMCAVKIVPLYSEYLSIRNIVQQVAEESQPGTTSITQIRRRIDRLFITNQIYAIQAKDVEVYRDKGVTYIDGSYEARVAIAWRIDAIMKFDDLQFVAGQSSSQ